MKNITYKDMLAAGVHFGHKTRYWNPKNADFIYGVYQNLHIIDLRKTKDMLEQALTFAENIVENRGRIVFVGTKRTAQEVVIREAQRCGMPYVNWRWLGGMLTNFKTIRQSVNKLIDLELMFEGNQTEEMTKKEKLSHYRELTKLEGSIGGIRDLTSLPDALFVVDVGMEHIAVREACKLGIPVIGIIDTNNDPEGITYPIPGNDDSISAIEYYASLFADVIDAARSRVAAKDKAKLDVSITESKASKKAATKKPAVKETKAASEAPVEKTEAVKAAKPAIVESEPKAEAAKPAAKKATTAAKKPAAKKADAAEAKPAAKKATTTAKKPAAKKADATEAKPAAAAKKPAAKKPAVKKAATKKAESAE